MFKKVNSKILALLFILLLAFVVIVLITDSKKGNSSAALRDIKISEIDTSKITKMVFYPKEKKPQFELSQNTTGIWEVKDNEKSYAADENLVNSLLTELANIKVERIAAKSKNSWEKYQLTDSAGIRVVIMDNKETLADIVIGKFSYQQLKQSNPYQQNNMKFSTFIRNYDNEITYQIDGMMSMNFNVSVNSLRNKNLCKLNRTFIKKITFSYPADSSFTLSNINGQWNANGIQVDSLATTKYLNTLSNLTSSSFINDIQDGYLPQNNYTVKIEGDNFTPVEIGAFPYNTYERVIKSSENPDTYFNGDASDLFNKIFISLNSLK